MLVQFFGGPIDGLIQDIPDNVPLWKVPTHDSLYPPNYGVIVYINTHSIMFSGHNPPTHVFRMERPQ